MKFEVLAKVNPIGSMKTWGKPSCTLCMKERLEMVSRSRRRYGNLINACSEIYGAYRIGLSGNDDPLKVKESRGFLPIRIEE